MRLGDFRDDRERRVILGIVFATAVLVFMMIFALQAYRHSTVPRTVATILDIRKEECRGGRSGPYTAIIGILEFSHEVNGQIVTCRTKKEIGRHPDRHEIGQKLEVIPATGTCNRVDIVNPM